jgi:hypothetical protein
VKKKTLLPVAFISILLFSTVAATQFINLAQANPYGERGEVEGVVPAPEGTVPPTISILSPENDTAYASNTVPLTLNVSTPESRFVVTEIYYMASWLSSGNVFIKNQVSQVRSPINLTDVPEGSRWLWVYAVATGLGPVTRVERQGLWTVYYYVNYMITGSSFVNFTVDTTAPSILSLSVDNKTYSTSNVMLNVLVNEPVSQVIYSLDGKANVTAAGNTTLTGLSDGGHKLTVYATDMAGNAGNSETIYFSVEEPFPTELAITASGASIAAVAAGLLVYLKKRKHAPITDKAQ